MAGREALKDRAYNFLESLKEKLTAETPAPAEMRQRIHGIVADAKNDEVRKHMRQPESAFLCHYAIPIIFRHMQSVAEIGESEAKKSLLSESYRHMPALCSGTPARSRRHAFSKVIGTKADILAQWAGQLRHRLTQPCPDFAFREPFPFKIVFEGKYFQQGGIATAKKELAANIYQAYFYRALPYVPPKKKSSPAWDYDFACLLAYDASENGSLKRAWDDLDCRVKRGFWERANVYVMILPAESSVSPAD